LDSLAAIGAATIAAAALDVGLADDDESVGASADAGAGIGEIDCSATDAVGGTNSVGARTIGAATIAAATLDVGFDDDAESVDASADAGAGVGEIACSVTDAVGGLSRTPSAGSTGIIAEAGSSPACADIRETGDDVDSESASAVVGNTSAKRGAVDIAEADGWTGMV